MKDFLIDVLGNALLIIIILIGGTLLVGALLVTLGLLLEKPVIGVPLSIIEAAIIMALSRD